MRLGLILCLCVLGCAQTPKQPETLGLKLTLAVKHSAESDLLTVRVENSGTEAVQVLVDSPSLDSESLIKALASHLGFSSDPAAPIFWRQTVVTKDVGEVDCSALKAFCLRSGSSTVVREIKRPKPRDLESLLGLDDFLWLPRPGQYKVRASMSVRGLDGSKHLLQSAPVLWQEGSEEGHAGPCQMKILALYEDTRMAQVSSGWRDRLKIGDLFTVTLKASGSWIFEVLSLGERTAWARYRPGSKTTPDWTPWQGQRMCFADPRGAEAWERLQAGLKRE